MRIIKADEIQTIGGRYLPDGKISVENCLYVRGGSFPEKSRDFAVAMGESYVKSGVACLLILSSGMITIWREEKALEAVSSPALPPLPPSNVAPVNRPFLISYVDDSPIEAKLMEKILVNINCTFTHIKDSTLAVPTMLKTKPGIVFLDLNMPIVNGYEICSQLRRVPMFQETPIVIVTGNDGLVDRVRAKIAGATDFISKPIDREQVTSLLRKHQLIA